MAEMFMAALLIMAKINKETKQTKIIQRTINSTMVK